MYLCKWRHYWNCLYKSTGERRGSGDSRKDNGIYQFAEMKIVIIKYNAGNIRSVLFALERIGTEALVTDDPDLIVSADKIIFPGVGEASSAMNYLKERKLDRLIKNLRQPVLGVCLGMQLLCTYSEENETPCIGIFDETVKKFAPGED